MAVSTNIIDLSGLIDHLVSWINSRLHSDMFKDTDWRHNSQHSPATNWDHFSLISCISCSPHSAAHVYIAHSLSSTDLPTSTILQSVLSRLFRVSTRHKTQTNDRVTHHQWSYIGCQNSNSASSSNFHQWPLLVVLVPHSSNYTTGPCLPYF